MGTENMNNLITSSSPDMSTLAVQKLRDDGSNWSDYEPHIQNAMGAKGLWRHVSGNAIALVPYAISNGVPMLANGEMPASEDQIKSKESKTSKDQIEPKESKIFEFEKREYLPCHIILSTTLIHLGSKIKVLKTSEDMWKAVIEDAMSKSTLYLLDAEDQLASMKLPDNEDPKC